jgi:CubicO group peptidase (beta-lactamase class C family)
VGSAPVVTDRLTAPTSPSDGPSFASSPAARTSSPAPRALGWDTPSPNSSAGTLLSPESFGHTGFTGTSIWIDPSRELVIVLLSNRVHPTRDNPRIFPLRRELADRVVTLLTRHDR